MPDYLDLTLGELAALTELPERTLRLYRTKGLLDPPTVRGRVGHYGDLHVRQLRIVKALTGRGFPLAEIAQLTSRGLSRTALMLLLDTGSPQTDASGGPVAPMDTILASVAVDRINAVDLGLLPRLQTLGVLHEDSDGQLRVDSLGLAIVSDLTRVGLEIEDVAELAVQVGDLALQARQIMDTMLHPIGRDTAADGVLIDAATAVFRETLRNAGRR